MATMFNEGLRGQSDIGLIGLGVMGENIILNMASHKFRVSVYNRTTEKTEEFINNRARPYSIVGTKTLPEFVASLRKPRKIMMLVKAGNAVDIMINNVLPLLSPGDVLIDGGNSYYTDSQKRCESLQEKGILFVGMGVSGGEEGALLGPSLMPGGDPDAWPIIQPIMQAIAAKAKDGKPCCEWVGPGGAGHFVKTVHNGIEYGDIQLICEAYDILRRVARLSNDEMSAIFRKWNDTELNSYLIEITADILAKKEDGKHVIDYILDVAGQKGTGKWTVSSGVELGVPLNVISEAVSARYMSSHYELRQQASTILFGEEAEPPSNIEVFVEEVRTALCTAKVISYAQGFELLKAKSIESNWKLNFAAIARSWRGGCIIRSGFLDKISDAFTAEPELPHLLFAPFFLYVHKTLPRLAKACSL
jgi:6-phosphogluconate dehydrogenase